MHLFIFATLALQATPVDVANASGAVTACKSSISNGVCNIVWNDASLSLNNDGSGSIEVRTLNAIPLKWHFSCNDDPVEGNRICTLQQDGISIARFTGSVHTFMVTWGGTKFPGSEKVAKIGRFAPMRWRSDEPIFGRQAVKVIEAAKSGGSAIFRWYDWPEQNVHDEKVNFDRFSVVWQIFKASTE